MGSSASSAPKPNPVLQARPSKVGVSAEKLAAWEATLTPSEPQQKERASFKACGTGISLVVAGVTHIGPGDPPIKSENQDTFVLEQELGGSPNLFLGCVFDGHGSYGKLLSQFCCDWIATRLHGMLEQGTESGPEAALRRCFFECDAAAHSDDSIGFRSKLSGTTATAVLIDGCELYVACVGDSRAVLASEDAVTGTTTCRRLTRDHRPDLDDERERILRSGGDVQTSCAASGSIKPNAGPLRVYLSGDSYKDHGLSAPGPGLMLTRSLGDRIAKAAGCIAEPEVKSTTLSAQERFLVIGSDGVWDVMEDDEVVEVVQGLIDSPVAAADAVLAKCLELWGDSGRADNITACVHPPSTSSSD